MTRYDPFAYGEVRLDPNQQKGGSPPDAEDMLFADAAPVKQAPPADSSWALLGEDVDDLLPGSAPNARETAAFGADILGEEDEFSGAEPMAAMMAPEELAEPAGFAEYAADDEDALAGFVAAQPAANLLPSPSLEPIQPAVEAEVVAQPRKRREVRRRPISVPANRATAAADGEQVGDEPVRKSAKGKKSQQPRVSGPRRPTMLAALVPLCLCVAGGTAASWFWVMQANPVMAGILGATTLVGALLSWLFLRG